MKKNIAEGFVFILLLSLLSGCTDKVTKKAVYDALDQRQCIEDTGTPNCADRPSYEEYQRQRQELSR